MAVWQWDIWIVPRKEILSRFKTIPEYLDLDWFESVGWWQTLSERNISSFFRKRLPVFPMPWAVNTEAWGSEDGDRVVLAVETNTVTDFVARIDVSDLSIDFLLSLIEFATNSDCLFFTLESGRFVNPVLGDLLKEIEKSRKMIFLRNPKSFFEDKRYLDAINEENRKRIRRAD